MIGGAVQSGARLCTTWACNLTHNITAASCGKFNTSAQRQDEALLVRGVRQRDPVDIVYLSRALNGCSI